jgi:tetratricopeptide (TPR) repeat protein
MRFARGLVLALGLAAVSGACAAGSAGGAGTAKPTASGLPQATCSVTAGVSAQTAQAAYNRTLIPGIRPEVAAPFYQQTLTAAQQDPANPFNQYLAGEAYVGMNQLAQADTAFRKTVELCPGFADEVANARKVAFQTAYNAAVASLQAHDTATAIAGFSRAAGIYDRSPDVLFNLGVLYGQTGDVARAVQYYRQALSTQAEPDTTAEGRAGAADMRANAIIGLVNAGGQYFQKENFTGAVDVFRTVTQLDPNSRDAWYNLGLALYKQNRWNDLVPVAQKITQIDPLNYNARIILFNAYKGLADAAGNNRNDPNRQNALNTLAFADSMPVQVEGIQVANTSGNARISGTVVGAKAPAGRPVTLEFTLYGVTGRLGTQTVTVNAPAKDQRAPFELTLATPVAATTFSYRLVS